MHPVRLALPLILLLSKISEREFPSSSGSRWFPLRTRLPSQPPHLPEWGYKWHYHVAYIEEYI